MVAAIAAVIAGVVFAMGGALNDSFTKTQTCLANATANTPPNFDRCPPNP